MSGRQAATVPGMTGASGPRFWCGVDLALNGRPQGMERYRRRCRIARTIGLLVRCVGAKMTAAIMFVCSNLMNLLFHVSTNFGWIIYGNGKPLAQGLRGPMDKALVYGTRDSGFDPQRSRLLFFFIFLL
jgi:hypothetical protein